MRVAELKATAAKSKSVSFILRDAQKSIRALEKSIKECEKQILALYDSDEELKRSYDHLTSIKGISGYEPDGSFTTSKGNEWQMFDAGIAAQTFCLSAHNYGVGSVIMGIFDEREVARIIGLDKSRVVSALIAIGYPVQEPNPPKRKDVREYVSFI